MKRYFRRYLDASRRHPFLLVSQRDLKATASRLFRAREPFLVKALSTVSRLAHPDPKEPAHVGGDRQARATLNAAYLAALYAAAGDRRRSTQYARRARHGLLAYANMAVPGDASGYGWLTQLYLMDLALAYDLAWDVGDWTPAERDLLRNMLYSDMDALVEHMHDRRLSNHAAWPMCRMATTAALFGDEKLLREALDGPDSYCVRLAHEFFDDGMSYEQSTTVYQDFSVEPNLITALAARGAGTRPNPLTIKVNNDLSLAFRGGSTGDFDMPFYPVSTRDFLRPATKDLRLAVTAQFGLARPDTTFAAMGDYGAPATPLSDSWLTELAWDLYGDPRAARLLSLGKRASEGSHIFDPGFLTLVYGKPLPAKASYPVKSLIYPQAGFAVLRSIQGDDYWQSQAIEAVMKFGPFGNGHGHADKLHLDLSGAGKNTCIEELHRLAATWRYWNSTVSHNSVVVGGKSQPGDEEMFAIGNSSCGRLVFRRFSPKIKIACAEAPDVYKGLSVYRRTVAVTDSYVFDVFEVEANKPTDFDWFIHGKGALTVTGAALKKGAFGYKSHGYQFLKDVKRADVASDYPFTEDGKWRADWSGSPAGRVKTPAPLVAHFSEGHTVHLPHLSDATVFTATGPWKQDARRPALVFRQRGKRAVFIAIHDPSGKDVTGVELIYADKRILVVHILVKGFSDVLRMCFAPVKGKSAAEGVLYFRKKARLLH